MHYIMCKEIKAILSKYRQALLYLIFGVLTTLVNIGVYYLASDVVGLYYLLANVVAWILSVLFAFITNKSLVFESK